MRMAAHRRRFPISRRRFVQGAGVAGVAFMAGCGRLPEQAQQPAVPQRVYRIGVLGSGIAPLSAPLRQGLQELGYVEGQNLVVEYGDAEGRTQRYGELAADPVALPVDVIVAQGHGALRASRGATSTIPIVSLGAGVDLVQAGFVDSLARPGGNLTGMTSANDRLVGKRLQLLKKAAPPMERVGVLWNRNDVIPFERDWWEERAGALSTQLLVLEPYGPEELEAAFETAVREHADALYVVPTALSNAHLTRIIALAAQHRMPAMDELEPFVRAGGLMAYLGSTSAMHRRAATFC
jgi:putative ABC transport system substrate-binding protein